MSELFEWIRIGSDPGPAGLRSVEVSELTTGTDDATQKNNANNSTRFFVNITDLEPGKNQHSRLAMSFITYLARYCTRLAISDYLRQSENP